MKVKTMTFGQKKNGYSRKFTVIHSRERHVKNKRWHKTARDGRDDMATVEMMNLAGCIQWPARSQQPPRAVEGKGQRAKGSELEGKATAR